MLMLAWAENETWSNNATGFFKQFFRALTSGTEAPPALRFQIIDRALADVRPALHELAVKALRELVADQHGARIVGAEYRGGAEPLQEWKPVVWQEIFDYWSGGIARLVILIVSGNPCKNQAKSAIADSIRRMMSYGRVDMLDQAVRAVVAADGQLWPEAVAAIRLALQYDSAPMDDETKLKLQDWLALLQPTSIPDQLSLYVTHSSFELAENEQGEHVDHAVERAKDLARDLSSNIPALLPYLDVLFEGEQRQAYVFGKALVEASREFDLLIEKSLQVLSEKTNPNDLFFRGVLAGTYELNQARWHEVLQGIGADQAFDRYYNYLLTSGRPNRQELERSIELIVEGRQSPRAVEPLAYGRVLNHLQPHEVADFALRLSSLSSPAAWHALEVLYMYAHGNSEVLSAIREAIKSIVLRMSLADEEQKSQIIWHSWESAVRYVLSEEITPEFSIALTELIFVGTELGTDFSATSHYVKPILRELFRKFGRETWAVFASRLHNLDLVLKYEFTVLLGSESLFKKDLPPVVSELPDELMERWCIEHPEFAPAFLAMFTDVISNANGVLSISPRARFLLDRFGDNPAVLSHLGSNLATFSWQGSPVTYYERELAVLTTIETHPIEQVRQWVGNRMQSLRESIAYNRMRDSEREWGIY